MGRYNVRDWYWVLGDGPAGQVYSSARAQYVPTTDATYKAWLAINGAPNSTPTYAEMIALIGQSFPTGTPYGAFVLNGVTVTSSSTPALNGVYAIDAQTQLDISTEASFVAAFSEFTTGSATNLPWQLANGTFVTFPTTASFMAFAKAIGQLVASAKLASAQGTSMPAAVLTLT